MCGIGIFFGGQARLLGISMRGNTVSDPYPTVCYALGRTVNGVIMELGALALLTRRLKNHPS